MSGVVAHVDKLLGSDGPDPEIWQWLKDGFRRHVETGESLTAALGIVDECHHGLPTEIRRLAWRRHLAKAVRILACPGVSTASIAKILEGEFSRLHGVKRRPVEPVSAHVWDALQAHPTGGMGFKNLYIVVTDIRAQLVARSK